MNRRPLFQTTIFFLLILLLNITPSYAQPDEVKPTPTAIASARINVASMPLPDLTIPEDSIRFDTDTPFEGRTVFIYYTLKNIGDAPAVDFETVAYFTGEDGEIKPIQGTRRDHRRPSKFLPAGDQLKGEIRWDDFDKVGKFEITLVTDGHRQVYERYETNNEATASLFILPDYETMTRQANSMRIKGETPEAIDLYRKSIQVIEGLREWAPGHPRFLEEGNYKFLLYNYIMMGDYEAAIREGRHAVEVYPKGFHLGQLLASALLHQGATEEAIVALREPPENFPPNNQVPVELLWTEEQEGKKLTDILKDMPLEERIDYLSELVSHLPAVPDLLTQLAYEQRFDNQFDAAMKNFQTAFHLTEGSYYPFDGYRLIAWLVVLSKRGDIDEFMRVAENGLDELNRPGNLLTYFATLGYTYDRISDEEALGLLQEALEGNLVSYWKQQALYHSGVLQERLSAEYLQQAKQSYQQTLKINKDFKEAKKAVERLENQR